MCKHTVLSLRLLDGGRALCSHRAVGSEEAGCRTVSRGGLWIGRRDEPALGQSDLLLEGSLGSPGGRSSSGRLDGLVGHDACGKLLLGLLKTGTGGAVHPVNLHRSYG